MKFLFINIKNLIRIIVDTLSGKKPSIYTFYTKKSFFKFPLTAKKSKAIHREVRLSQHAKNSVFYDENCIPTSNQFLGGASSKRVNTKINFNTHFTEIINMWDRQSLYLGECKRIPANEIYHHYINELKKDGLIDGEASNTCYTTGPQCSLPVSFMHGDFCPSNLALSGSNLSVIDWEWASSGGSILLDWWCLRKYVIWLISLDVIEPRIQKYFDDRYFDSLSQLGIEHDTLDYYGDKLEEIRRSFIG